MPAGDLERPEALDEPSGEEPVALDLSRADVIALYRGLALHRAAEERLELLHKQGHVGGGVYRGLGQEAVAVGSAFAMRRTADAAGDVIAQTIRTAGGLFLFGGTPLEYFQQYLARGTGPTAGREANVHYTCFDRGLLGPVSPLGTMVEVMAGITMAFRMKGEDRVGLAFSGDGQTSTGAWHEGFNFAAVRQCPLIVIVQANQWAFSTPTSKQTRVRSFAEKARGYGVAGESVDGTDVLAVYDATRRARGHALAGEGVTLIEARTYRMKGHAQHDSQDYVPKEDLEKWSAKDPIRRFRMKLIEEGWADDAALNAIDGEVEAEALEAAEQALSDPLPEGEWALTGVYTDVEIDPLWVRLDPPGRPTA